MNFKIMLISLVLGPSAEQVSANRVPDLTFAVEGNIKSLCPKSSRGSILNRLHEARIPARFENGDSINIQACINKSAKLEAQIVKANF